ncbi:hypothetical protein G3480_17150 [Thiorhodococcus mannitoliphagus]|uniref:HMA domain-containing protein n=1 Tax=Thiorhodococcus mannitoliphagus TaxID=329406 RepID=A0A6P1DYC7_9GAMM|nr:permease [Thiorhodococcus mannitoliphagus]NEX22011.1 hypothetical protein [Thiorhodococcus mannitoliphagus]
MVDQSFFAALWQVLIELSPSLLLGLLIAGLMHVYLPSGFVHRGLSRPDLRSVARASLVGVPLPLCSCGVIPTALGLRNEGASKGATTAFMISTPQTGVDSILVSAAFLGWPFAIFKVVAAFVTGIIGGALVNRLTAFDAASDPEPAPTEEGRERGLIPVLRYAVIDLLGAIDLWILAGVLLAALLTVVLPSDYFASQGWSQGILGMLVVLAISLPLYVCTTGSVPIAASLIAAGLPAGSALVFLMAGPATNIATFGAVYRVLGRSILIIYLGTVVVMSVLFGLLFDSLLAAPAAMTAHGHSAGANWLGGLSAVMLLGLMGYLSYRRIRRRTSISSLPEPDLVLQVQGMSCQHCVSNVRTALEGLDSVDEAQPDLGAGLVRVRGAHLDVAQLVAVIEHAGYKAQHKSS